MSNILYLDQIFDKIIKIRNIVEEEDKNYYTHTFLSSSNQSGENPSISIVMTSSNRSKQVYYTIKSISDSLIAKKVHIVLIDDSDIDTISIHKLSEFLGKINSIDFISINKDKKCWVNPCINYNIGFRYINKNSKNIVIQNGEVCHVGDVIKYINESVNDNEYHVFDVKATADFESNEKIYNLDQSSRNISVYDNEDFKWYIGSEKKTKWKEFNDGWYQTHKYPRNYHFLTSMTSDTFKRVKSFSYDYAMQINYDDDDFLFKIINVLKINIINPSYLIEKIGGIHLFHENNFLSKEIQINVIIYDIKMRYINSFDKYLELSDNISNIITVYKYLLNKKKTIVTITGIRPDFIRMCQVFKKLDANFNHILIHTGQHYDTNLSSIIFKQLNIREPDYILNTGSVCTNHYEQLAYLSIEIPKLFKNNNINPDLIVFLGDANTSAVSLPLKKEGYKICHIEAGMRSYDKRMLEEINRIVCDNCSDLLFVYHEDYKKQLALENIHKNVYVVGNTVVEPLNIFRESIMSIPKKKDMILLDIHRPENFNYPDRLSNIFKFANECIERYNLPVKMLYFKRLIDSIQSNNLDLGKIEMINLLPYVEYLNTVYHSMFIISDSGTGQEEPSLLNTFVVVPRDFTERPQSYKYNCSIKLDLNQEYIEVFKKVENIEKGEIIDPSWLYSESGIETSKLIVDNIITYLNN